MFTYIPKYNDLSDVEYKDYRTEEEREFLTHLHNHSAMWEKYGYEDDDFIMFYDGDTVTVALDICDNIENVILRCLRIDFNKTNLLLGDDGAGQLLCKLSVDIPYVEEYRKDEYSTKELAEISAKWLINEILRKIELRVWMTDSIWHRYYVIDRENSSGMSDSENIKRWGKGTSKIVRIVSPQS